VVHEVSPTLILRTTRRLATVLLLLTARVAAPPARAGHEEARKAGETRENPASLTQPLGILAAGGAAAHRRVAETACQAFVALESPSYDETERGRIVEELRRFIWREEDDWISARLIQELGCMPPSWLPSTSARWAAPRPISAGELSCGSRKSRIPGRFPFWRRPGRMKKGPGPEGT
jgi:hypothetical protein